MKWIVLLKIEHGMVRGTYRIPWYEKDDIETCFLPLTDEPSPTNLEQPM